MQIKEDTDHILRWLRFNIKVSFCQIDFKIQSHSNQTHSRFCVGEGEFEILQDDLKFIEKAQKNKNT